MAFVKSESNLDLLHLPDHSSPRMITEFTLENIGGGLIAVNTYGDCVVSVGPLMIGTIGETWTSKDSALDFLCLHVDYYSEKCTATDIDIGGCGVLLYFSYSHSATDDARGKLLQTLAIELASLASTKVLCLPGVGVTINDLEKLYKANEKLRTDSTSGNESGEDEKKMDGTESPASRRSRSVSIASEKLDYPVPAALVQNPNSTNEAAAHSAVGAIITLAQARKWQTPSILLVGLTPVSRVLFDLLSRKNYEVYLSDQHEKPEDYDPSRWIAWDQAPSYRCDILVACCGNFPELTPEFIEKKLRCHNVISIADNLLPLKGESREETHLAMEEKGIFDFCDGLCDVGAVAKIYHQSQKTVFSVDDSFKMGANVMRKTLHLAKIVEEYDKEEKHNFYKLVLSKMDQNKNEQDLNLGLGTILHNSSERMTEWMWAKARGMCPAFRALSSKKTSKDVFYMDLGAGTGKAARWICKQNPRIHFKCVNISPKQNAENRQLSDEEGLGGQISVETCSFENLPADYSNLFDGCIAQDSFFHSFNKLKAFSEALKVTKGGGWIMVSDLMKGEAGDIKSEELKSFAEKNNIKKWYSASECVEVAKEAGWVEEHFIDCTTQIKKSLGSLLEQVMSIIESRRLKGLDLKLLQSHRVGLVNRIGQVDRGVFKWGIIAARKPYDVVFMSEPPVTPDPSNTLMSYSTNLLDGDLKFGTDVVVLNISDRMPRDAIMSLPSTVRLIVTMSAGLDHISMEAAEERGIRVRRAARDQIVKSVADYLLSNIIFGLRNGFQNVGVPFPGKDWNLSWNADGVDLDRSKIGFIGMGAIAIETARRLRSLSTECEMVYNIPKGIRCRFEEGTFNMYHVGIADLISTCDVVIPMTPLTPSTEKLIGYSSFAMMTKKALFINMARGKVVDTDGLTRALEEGIIRHAILDTTDPEPLPEDHPLWKMPNCTITPHFATNTIYVREELVIDIPNQVEDTLEERGILRLEEQKLRKELSDAYRITREFGMDELVWNHISALLSDGHYLITPGSRMFDDISPQDLVKSGDSGNVTADIIHDSIYRARPDVRAIVHLHTPATVAVSCLEMGFVALAQEAAPFVGRVASYPWHGVSNDWEEQKLIGKAIADQKYNTLLLENHGYCCFGKTLGEAWVLSYYFDKACKTQLNCLQTGVKIRYPDPNVLAHAAEQALLPEFLPGACEWEALRKMLTRKSKRW